MADNIVGNLFGVDMQTLKSAMDAKGQADNLALARLDPYQAQRYYANEAGRAIGKGVNTLFGLEDPMITKQRQENEVLQQVQSSLSPEDLQDPVKLSQAVFTAAQSAGLQDLASHAYNGLQQGRLQNAKIGQEVAQTQKAQMDIALKQQDYLQQAKAQEAISTLWKAKQELGETPTNEEIIGVAAQYMPADKLATLMQTSADKEAYRNVLQRQIDQAHEDKVLRIESMADEKAKDRELKIELAKYQRDTQSLVASLKGAGGSKSSVYERGYANNFVTSSAELVPATTNLNILTNGGTSPITAGVFTNLKGTGLLSATGAAFGTTITPAESGQYESIMLPVIANIATMQNAGRRTTQAQVENLKNALIVKPGQPYIVQVQKMGELRQIVEAAAEAAQTNPAMSEEQLAAIQGNVERVRQSIPFTGADVAKFSNYLKKNPSVKFVDWLKVNGEDKAILGGNPIPQGAIDKLKANPALAKDFDTKFGAGASKKYLEKK
jgi:chemotaxis protein histidine kinase CheA